MAFDAAAARQLEHIGPASSGRPQNEHHADSDKESGKAQLLGAENRKMQNAKCKMQNVDCRIPNLQFAISGTARRVVVHFAIPTSVKNPAPHGERGLSLLL